MRKRRALGTRRFMRGVSGNLLFRVSWRKRVTVFKSSSLKPSGCGLRASVFRGHSVRSGLRSNLPFWDERSDRTTPTVPDTDGNITQHIVAVNPFVIRLPTISPAKNTRGCRIPQTRPRKECFEQSGRLWNPESEPGILWLCGSTSVCSPFRPYFAQPRPRLLGYRW